MYVEMEKPSSARYGVWGLFYGGMWIKCPAAPRGGRRLPYLSGYLGGFGGCKARAWRGGCQNLSVSSSFFPWSTARRQRKK